MTRLVTLALVGALLLPATVRAEVAPDKAKDIRKLLDITGSAQLGAQVMAQRGASYRDILTAFYPGAELRREARP